MVKNVNIVNFRFIFGLVLVIVPALILVACDRFAQSKSARILFVEQETNIEPYQTRVVVTPEFLRIDDGEGAQDFLLFDRKKNLIYSVNSAEQGIMIVEPQKQNIDPPFELKVTEKLIGELKDAPTIKGSIPKHYQLLVNDVVCYNFVTVDGILADAVLALRQLQEVLASDSMLTVNAIPADMHDPCSLAMNTFEPNRNLNYGFPVQEWGKRGYVRTLMDFDDDYLPEPALFELPEGYRRYTVQDLRTGNMPGPNT